MVSLLVVLLGWFGWIRREAREFGVIKDMPLVYGTERALQLSRQLDIVRAKIEQAATQTGGARVSSSPLPELVVVTKFFPASDVAALYDLGVRRVGENRDQEASIKADELVAYADADDLMCWSFIGQLQTNKARSVVRYATEVQSVDRVQLVTALSKAYCSQIARYEAGEGDAPAGAKYGGLRCLIQVSLEGSGAATAGQGARGYRGGADAGEIELLADLLEDSPGLRLGGLMAVAPLGQDPYVAFEELHSHSQKLRENHPDATDISAGMSQDMQAAIYWGATTVRVGSQIMGPRPSA